MSRALLKELPRLVNEGLITPEQAGRIHARFAGDAEHSGNRLLLVFSILGSLLVGLGIVLIIAHNWDDLPRVARTVISFVPVLLGQGFVAFTLLRRPSSVAWREGSAVLLACGLCACVALMSQIHHIGGDLSGYLLTCSMLILPLLYVPGSIMAALAYLAMITWYGATVRFEHWSTIERPWLLIPLIAAAVPFYLRQARSNGGSIGFWWFSLFLALTIGIGSQFFLSDLGIHQVLGIMALAGAYTLVPWLHPGRALRTWPWVLVGGAAMLIIFCTCSFRFPWNDAMHFGNGAGRDAVGIGVEVVIGCAAYVLSLRRRKPLERWPYPEGWWLYLACYLIGLASPALAAILVNLSLLVIGVFTVKAGTEQNSLRRMNLGLTILGATIMMRFFDTDLSFVVRGLVFIAMGAGFLYMNLRLVRQRQQRPPHAP